MAEGSARILLVDDEHAVQKLLAYPLRKEGYEVVPARDGREALDRFAAERFDLVVLDIMLPKLDGIEVCRRLRSRSQVPIIMLTAKDDEIDKVLGLEMGADDYITKPFSMREFRSRVKAALRRSDMLGPRPPAGEPIVAGALEIDFDRRGVMVGDRGVRLTYVEFEILAALAADSGRVHTREMLLERVWGDSEYRDPRTIDVHIRHLREKIERDPKHPAYLFTARGDPDRVAQIIRILLDNALTHTREGTAISVTTMQGGGTAGLVVTDTGAGIDPRTRGRVFERFYTGDSVSGSGLGLAIARELAMRMEGSLRVASRRGHTEFTLELPGGTAGRDAGGPN